MNTHSQAIITLKATLVTASDDLRAELEPLSTFNLVHACALPGTGARASSRDRTGDSGLRRPP